MLCSQRNPRVKASTCKSTQKLKLLKHITIVALLFDDFESSGAHNLRKLQNSFPQIITKVTVSKFKAWPGIYGDRIECIAYYMGRLH